MLFTLEKIKQAIKVDKRRIYDIVNVLSALRFIRKVAKGHYKWNSVEKAQRFIAELQGRPLAQRVTPTCLSDLCLQFLCLFPPGSRVPSERVPELLLLANAEASGLKAKRITNLLKIFLAVGLAEFVPSRHLAVIMLDASRIAQVVEQITRQGADGRAVTAGGPPRQTACIVPLGQASTREGPRAADPAPARPENLKLLERYITSGSIILPKVRVPQTAFANNKG